MPLQEASVQFCILGPLRVTDAGVELPVGGPRHRALLAALLVRRGTAVSADRLIDVLWGENPPRSAAEMLHVRISELRRALAGGSTRDAGVVVTAKSGYRLVVGPDDVDADQFESLVLAGRAAGDANTAASLYVEALALWRGAALPELGGRAYARAETARLDDLRVQALEARMDAGLAAGQHLDLVPDLRALVIDHPLRERFWYQLMLALHRSGRSIEALEAYREAHRVMVGELGIEPSAELQTLHTTILQRDTAAVTGNEERPRPGRAQNNLPANLTSFVGRHDEQVEVAGLLLGHARLVTLTGVGGVGKSRLAVEIAAAHLAAYPDGVWLVELAPLTDPALLVPVVASVAGVREHPERSLFDQIVRRFHSAEVLLILDNCEHLATDVAEFVRQLLDACPLLRVLCTSRERLRVSGEVLRPLTGLSTRRTTGGSATDAEAVTLFAQRARAVRAGFVVSEQTARTVTQICARLDGLPLAIELAAARIGSYSPAQIAAGLDDRLRLLTRVSQVASPRHRTLRAVIDWSYDHLDEGERRVFERLSIFVGGFTFDAAEAVCGGDDGLDLIDVLALLVDKSLVTAEAAPIPEYRYRLLETLQAYAAERRDDRGDTDAQCRRHAAYFATLAEAAHTGLRSSDQAAWLDRLASDHDNIRAALEFLLADGDVETAGRMAGSVYPFWDLRGHYTEGRRWLNRVLAGVDLTPRTRARVLMGATTLAVIQGDIESAVAACEAATDLSRGVGDGAGLAHAQQYLAFVAIYAEQFDEAEALIAESITAAQAAGADWEHGWAYIFAGTSALAQGDNTRAVEMTRQADHHLSAVGDREAFAWSSFIRSGARWAAGDNSEDFVEDLHRAIHDFHDLGGLWGLSLGLLLAGAVMCGGEHSAAAVRVLSAAESARASMGAGIYPFVLVWLRTALSTAAGALGADDFHREWLVGSTMSIPDAVADALALLRSGRPTS
jgi:predicted ATPase/DNA-binding SARP family transcriptional activator